MGNQMADEDTLTGSAEQETVQTGTEAVTETTDTTETVTEAKVEEATTADAEKLDKARLAFSEAGTSLMASATTEPFVPSVLTATEPNVPASKSKTPSD